jgi:glutamate synthase (NADPH/NADH) large chain
MSRPEFERENIVSASQSVAASKSADTPHVIEKHTYRPPAEGLYDPSLEKDSCGVGFIANIKGKKSHQIVSDALQIL